MKRFFSALLLAGLVLAVSSVQAAPITQWSYSIKGTFANSVFMNPNSSPAVVTSDSLTWGDPAESGRSALLHVDGNPFAGTANTYMQVGNQADFYAQSITLQHNNFPIYAGSSTLLSTLLSVSVDLAPVVNGVAGSSIGVQTFAFPVKFYETPNNPDGVEVGDPKNRDIFALTSGLQNFDFQYGEHHYYVNVFPTFANYFQQIPQVNIDVANGMAAKDPTHYTTLAPGTLGFTTAENGVTKVPFSFMISTDKVVIPPSTVPEPSTALLLGAGLLGLGALGRRKN